MAKIPLRIAMVYGLRSMVFKLKNMRPAMVTLGNSGTPCSLVYTASQMNYYSHLAKKGNSTGDHISQLVDNISLAQNRNVNVWWAGPLNGAMAAWHQVVNYSHNRIHRRIDCNFRSGKSLSLLISTEE